MKNKVLKNIWLSMLSVFLVSSVVYWTLGWWEWVENAADGDSLTHTVWNSLVDGVVKKTGSIAETITWVKTFSSSPVVPSPTESGEVSSKGYVDSSISASANGITYTKIAETNVSGSANVDFNWLSTTYDDYLIVARGIRVSIDDQYLNLRWSTDNGNSFITSSTYWWSRHRSMDSVYDRRQWNGNAINLLANLGTASHEKANINITLYNPAVASSYGYVRSEWTAAHKDSWITSWQAGWAQASAAAFNAVRLYVNSWTMTSGNFKLYGIKYN